MNKNDEIIQDFFKYIITLPETEYKTICNRMRSEGPIPTFMEKIICESDKKRAEIAKVCANT